MKYTVTVQKGETTETHDMDAESRFAIYADVRKEGGTVIDIKEHAEQKPHLGTWEPQWVPRSVPKIAIAHMAKNLSAMLTAGLSLSRALSVIEKESTSVRLKEIAQVLALKVEKGAPFHEALELYPAEFPKLLVSMVRVGEESGSMAEALGVVGAQMESADALAHKVRGALIYPAVVLVAIIIIAVLMLLFVVPTLTETFTQLHVALPWQTKVFISVSNFTVRHWVLMVSLLVLLAIGVPAVARSNRGRFSLVSLSLRLPVLGDLVREIYAARTARALSSLLSAGVPVLEALSITKEVIGYVPFEKALTAATDSVQKGGTLSQAFAQEVHLYPVMFGEMLGVGEETGKVAPMLRDTALYYENNVSTMTKDLSTIIEPLLILLIGLVVGVFAFSMIAPIYSISSAI